MIKLFAKILGLMLAASFVLTTAASAGSDDIYNCQWMGPFHMPCI